MRPSSSLFDPVLARGPVPALLSDGSWLAALLDVEAALARVEADAGLIPAAAADAVAAVKPDRFDVAALGAAAAACGNPVVPLVAALREAVGPDAATSVHCGATSQDILDTAAMLLARKASGAILADLSGAVEAAARLARAHRDTVMAGRTLLQQAVPVTFGLLAAGWLTGLSAAADRLGQVRDTRLAVQLGGPAGTLAGLAPDLPARLARAVGLAAPVLPWHADRTRIGDLAGSLGTVAGAVGKVARDVTLLAQSEVGEVSEGRPGGSSSMAHKRNPVAAVCALAGAAQAPGLVATLLAVMPQELQRAAGGWHAEWRPLRELLVATGSAAAWLRDCLENLVVHPDRMRANLSPGPVDTGFAAALVDRALGKARA
ncbi:MAG: 3-carboxy-cis,cis-muconate cycloisomerase [Actinobacteria bacterium]|nr:MAG: 3-carboxy-cis,cis-muconate cycloisomerase [Actinomycetota bacterium]